MTIEVLRAKALWLYTFVQRECPECDRIVKRPNENEIYRCKCGNDVKVFKVAKNYIGINDEIYNRIEQETDTIQLQRIIDMLEKRNDMNKKELEHDNKLVDSECQKILGYNITDKITPEFIRDKWFSMSDEDKNNYVKGL